MFAFKNFSIKGKLKLIIMVTSGVVLLLASTAFVVNDLVSFRRAMTRDLSTLAQIIGMNSRAALAFEDKQFAEDALGALATKPHVVYACIYDKNGRVFAQYRRHDAGGYLAPSEPQEDGHRFEDNHLVLFQQIKFDNKMFGTIYIQYDLEELRSRFKQYVGISAVIILVTFCVALLLSLTVSLNFVFAPLMDTPRCLIGSLEHPSPLVGPVEPRFKTFGEHCHSLARGDDLAMPFPYIALNLP